MWENGGKTSKSGEKGNLQSRYSWTYEVGIKKEKEGAWMVGKWMDKGKGEAEEKSQEASS